jgi:hypothetical protein
MKRVREEEIGERLKTFLEDEGWTVYAEVAPWGGGSRRCDLVATRGPVLFAIETKPAVTARAIVQGLGWIPLSNLTALAVASCSRDWETVMRELCRASGLGLLRVTEFGVNFDVPPPLRRRKGSKLANSLAEEQRTWSKPGNADNDYFTPWKRTVRRVASFVEAHGPCTLKEIANGIEHHYASSSTARAGILFALKRGLIPGLRVEKKLGGTIVSVAPTEDVSKGLPF